jgi:carbon-monoxide dehydrogenase iron sulfur subunit
VLKVSAANDLTVECRKLKAVFKEKPTMIAFDSDGCINCRICEDVCSYHFAGAFKPAVSAIRLERAGKFGKISAHVCTLCEGIAGGSICVASCPSEALYLADLGNGWGEVVRFDADLCIACDACQDECPEEAVARDEDAETYNICDLCGGDPQCVRWCPEKVLWVAGAVAEVV